MGDKRIIEGPQEIEVEFEDIYRMGRRLSFPEFDASTLVLKAFVINGVGDLQYLLEVRFPRHARLLEPPFRLPVEEHSHIFTTPLKEPSREDIPVSPPAATIFPPDVDTRIIAHEADIEARMFGIEMPHRDAVPDGFFDTL